MGGLASGTASAQTTPTITQAGFALAGKLPAKSFGWQYQIGRWSWLTATIRNPSDEELTATLIFRCWLVDQIGRDEFSREVVVPPLSDLQVAFPVQCPEPTAEQIASRELMPLKIEVDLVRGSELLDRRDTFGQPLRSGSLLVGVIGTDEDFVRMFEEEKLFPNWGPQLQPQGQLRAFPLAANDLPDDVLGLDPLSFLVVVEPDWSAFRSLQLRALVDWVEQGGVLIVVPSATEATSFRNVPDFLPVEVVGTRRLTELNAATSWSRRPIQDAKGFDVHEFFVRDGVVLLSDGDVPIIVRRARGMGSVVAVALGVTPELQVQEPYLDFWMYLFRNLQVPPAVDLERLHVNGEQFVEQFAGRDVIGRWFAMVSIGGYVIVLLAIMRLGKGDWRWGAVGGISVVAGIALTAAAPHLAPPSTNYVYDLWFASGSGETGELRFEESLNVLPDAGGDQIVRVNHTGMRVRSHDTTDSSVVRTSLTSSSSEVRFHSEKAKLKTVRLSGSWRLPGLTTRAEPREDGVHVHVVNETEFDVEGGAVKLGRRFYPYSKLAAGERQTVVVPGVTDSRPTEDFWMTASGVGELGLHRSMLTELFVDPYTISMDTALHESPRGAMQGTNSSSVVLSWIHASPIEVDWSPAGTSTEVVRRGVGLVTLSPKFEPPTDKFLVPAGTMVLEIPDHYARRFYFGRSVFRGAEEERGSVFTMKFHLPEWARPSTIESAWLVADFESEAYRLEAHAGDTQVELSDPAQGRFALPAEALTGETIELVFKIIPRDESSEWEREGYVWLLRQFEIECLCTSRRQDGRSAQTAMSDKSGQQ